MSTVAPQTNSEKLLADFIKEASSSIALPHEKFVISKYKNNAQKLLDAGEKDAETYIVLGACYGRLFKEKETREVFQEAFRKYQNNYLLNMNYSSVLRNLGYALQARQYALFAYEIVKGDIDAIHEIMCSCTAAGRVREAKEWLEQWNKEKPGQVHELNSMILGGYEIFVENEISDEMAENYLKLAFKDVRPAKYHKVFGIMPEEDEERTWVNFDFAIDADIDTIADMNISIAENLASDPDVSLPLNESIVAMVRPAVL